jgi:hypothetical protein
MVCRSFMITDDHPAKKRRLSSVIMKAGDPRDGQPRLAGGAGRRRR